MILGVESGRGSGVVADRDTSGDVARPGLFERLDRSARVTMLSAPAGSGKTVLLRSWISQAGIAEHVAWVHGGRDDRGPQRFWPAVVGALRETALGASLVQALTAAPDLDGWAVVERLVKDLAPVPHPLWLVIDDAHELNADALRQLELLVMQAPPGLRFVLATRHDARLRLHRLRLEGELIEIRANDLRFSLAEARELFALAGLELPESALLMLHERTEGWAAGLRLAALSVAGQLEPGRFAEFPGSERTVTEYLLEEVLNRQPAKVRQLLLRTSVVERVNGELANLLSGNDGGERTLQDLEQAGAFVVSLDATRSWFRYHQMFAEMLTLELRRTAPGEVAGLHRLASSWFAGHGFPVEAIRHAQATADWEQAGRLLADHWPSLHLGGRDAAVHELLAGFPAVVVAADAELAAVAAANELSRGSMEAAERYLRLAKRAAASVPACRTGRARLLLAIARLLLARYRANPHAVAEEGQRLEAMIGGDDAVSQDLRALALINLGISGFWTARLAEAERHLAEGVDVARRIGRPFLEFTGLAYQSAVEIYGSFAQAAELSRQAIGLARRHGWTGEPSARIAYLMLGMVLAWQGRLDEAEPWIQRAERTVEAEAEVAAAATVHFVRGILEAARGRDEAALAAFQAAARQAGHVAAPRPLNVRIQAGLVCTLVRLGETESAWRVLAGLGDQDREQGETRVAEAVLLLARDGPRAAVAALAPVLGGAAPAVGGEAWLVHAFVLEAIARDALGDSAAAELALERALDLAEPNGTLLWFLLFPAPHLLERHAKHRTTHAALIAEILSLLAGTDPHGSSATGPPPRAPLTHGEVRVLRYLPTNLTSAEIASELSVSRNTVKAHMRVLYAKLGTHRRSETVARARELGLLVPFRLGAKGPGDVCPAE